MLRHDGTMIDALRLAFGMGCASGYNGVCSQKGDRHHGTTRWATIPTTAQGCVASTMSYRPACLPQQSHTNNQKQATAAASTRECTVQAIIEEVILLMKMRIVSAKRGRREISTNVVAITI